MNDLAIWPWPAGLALALFLVDVAVRRLRFSAGSVTTQTVGVPPEDEPVVVDEPLPQPASAAPPEPERTETLEAAHAPAATVRGESRGTRFSRAELEGFRDATVPDLVGPELRLLFVGINPGLWTAATQTPLRPSHQPVLPGSVAGGYHRP